MPRRQSLKKKRGGWRGGGGKAATKKRGAAATKKGKAQPMPGPSQCHPKSGSTKAAHGCFPIEVLQKAAKGLSITDAPAEPATLRGRLETQLGLKQPCGERTFLMALPISEEEKRELARQYLRPAMPAGWKEDPDMWLDSNNIADVMNQYEEAFPHFEFMGPFPIDFAAPDPYAGGGKKKCLMNEICELRVQEAMKNGTKAIGIVYNLDPHFKSGSHWVANYIDIPGHKCYYFDSYGVAPPKQVASFMRWLTTQDPKMRLEYNSRRLQFSNTECGVYSIYFITRMLEGDRFIDLTRRRPNDSDMLDLRDWLFST